MAADTPAITSAVLHATGVRVRSLPVMIEDLLKGKKYASQIARDRGRNNKKSTGGYSPY